MSTDKITSESWFQIAEDDLNSAKKLNSQPNPIWSTAVYHCQQAAEKAAKALLEFHGEKPPLKKGHDIGYLLERLEAYGDELDDLDVKAATLSEFATKAINPGSCR
jgi:HEPN domain-containing protein